MRCLFGTQAYAEDVHFTSFTGPLLTRYFEEPGFGVVAWELRDQWLFEIEAQKIGAPGASSALAGFEDLLRRVGDAAGFLESAYRRVLDRDPDPLGGAFFTRHLESGTMTGRQVLAALLAAAEASASA